LDKLGSSIGFGPGLQLEWGNLEFGVLKLFLHKVSEVLSVFGVQLLRSHCHNVVVERAFDVDCLQSSGRHGQLDLLVQYVRVEGLILDVWLEMLDRHLVGE